MKRKHNVPAESITKECPGCKGAKSVHEPIPNRTLLQKLLGKTHEQKACSRCSGTGAVTLTAKQVEAARRQQEFEAKPPRKRVEDDCGPEIVRAGKQNARAHAITEYVVTESSRSAPIALP